MKSLKPYFLNFHNQTDASPHTQQRSICLESEKIKAAHNGGRLSLHVHLKHYKGSFLFWTCFSTLQSLTELLHMCFDRFLLAVESRDLSQADKSIISFFFHKMSYGQCRTYFSISQQLWPEGSAKWILSNLRLASYQKNWGNCLLF